MVGAFPARLHYDPRFISQNPHVKAGLTRAGVRWAFQSLETENWQPLTWISHMVDCDLYGLNAGGHHLTSLLLHVANSVLLLVWLISIYRRRRRTTTRRHCGSRPTFRKQRRRWIKFSRRIPG